ncbi:MULTISPECIES: STAS/SEC14 domain-containing protein [Sphingomonas]|uniref:STAS/SEC14 domain-containing protein n=1 Tax=Sphingomonas kyungheensis TaxID=1069987 RepID=A0ABU8H1P6_9SPHN|nr:MULTISPECIES: STAS/SEC14 domain-containing protein [unclassified Sphingomonas]EZP56990.1 hypothetical protein BW41_00483 [Sphingomonas sp. RIT328]
MPAQFNIAVEPARHLLTLTCAGFYLTEDVAALRAACEEACGQLPAAPHGHLILIDASGMRIQTREVVDAFTGIVRDPRLRSRRLAFVVNHSLARQQILRLPEPGRANVAFFDDRPAAEAWLFEDAVSGARTVARYRHAPASPMSAGHDCTAPNAA